MKRFRFTLLEILVVVSIIVLLLGLLSPLLSSSREKSRRQACKSNLKDLSVAFRLYATKNRGFYPRGLESVADTQLVRGRGYIALHQQNIARSPKIYKCPSQIGHNIEDDIYRQDVSSTYGVGQQDSNKSYVYVPNVVSTSAKVLHRSVYGNETVFIRERSINHTYEYGNILFGSGRVEGYSAFDASSFSTSWLSYIDANKSDLKVSFTTNPRSTANLQ